MTIAIIVHGGAKSVPENKVAANRAGCLAAVEAGWAVLRSGGSATEAVEVAIRLLEADQRFNAGFGATLNSQGEDVNKKEAESLLSSDTSAENRSKIESNVVSGSTDVLDSQAGLQT